MNQSNLVQPNKTRLAILGTIGQLHIEPLTYDLSCLRSIITTLSPDILCAEITREEWEYGDLSASAVELREALVPVVSFTDTVLVPVAPSSARFEDYLPSLTWRQRLTQAFDRLLRWGQRTADTPENIHSPVFESFCHLVCKLTEMTWKTEDRKLWNSENRLLAEGILDVLSRDPGRRVLAVVQCQRIYILEQYLSEQGDVIDLVSYQEL